MNSTMNSTACTLLILLPLLSALVSACHPDILRRNAHNPYYPSLKQDFLTTAFDSCGTDVIPKRVITLLEKTYEQDYTLALSESLYNSSDLIDFPNKKYLFGGINQNRSMGFFFFEQGGIGPTYHFVIYKDMGRFYLVEPYHDLKNASNLNTLKEYLEHRQ